MGSSFAVSAAYAHDPTGVSVTTTETTATIIWTHTAAGACATSNCNGLTDVDIVRVPGQSGATINTTLVSNSTAYMVYNNATTITTFTDHSLPEGTIFSYQVCHNEANAVLCTTALTESTSLSAHVAVAVSPWHT